MTTQLAAADAPEVETVAGTLSDETIPLPTGEQAESMASTYSRVRRPSRI
jgi:hypothetical protein